MARSQTDLVGSLSRQLQSISDSGWANIQAPVREGFEAAAITADALAAVAVTSRERTEKLEARLARIEEMVRRTRGGWQMADDGRWQTGSLVGLNRTPSSG